MVFDINSLFDRHRHLGRKNATWGKMIFVILWPVQPSLCAL